MVPIRLEWIPYKAVRKLQACSTRPLKLLKWFRPNAYNLLMIFQHITKVAPPLILRIWFILKAQQLIFSPMF